MASNKQIDIDGQKLTAYINSKNMTMNQLSSNIGAASGYVAHAAKLNVINPVHYKMICMMLNVPEDMFKPVQIKEAPAVISAEDAVDSGDELINMLKRIEKDIVRLGQVALDIREIIKAGNQNVKY